MVSPLLIDELKHTLFEELTASNGEPLCLTRKQKEIRERELEILREAESLLNSEGYLGLTMAKIATRLEYSKGTIYQHFSCKEEIIITLVIYSLYRLQAMFKRCLATECCERGKLFLAVEAYRLHIELHPVLFENFSTLKSPSILEKASEEKRNQLLLMEAQVMGDLSGLVALSAQKNDLRLPENISAIELTSAIWAMLYGALALEFTMPNLSHLGIASLSDISLKNIDSYLDALAWVPLSSEKDAQHWAQQARSELFSDFII